MSELATLRLANLRASVRIRTVHSGVAAAWLPLDGWSRTLLGAQIDHWRSRRPERFGKAEVQRGLLQSGETAVINRFRSLKRQVEWSAGRWLVRHMARGPMGPRAGSGPVRVAVDADGAPAVEGHPELGLSISHSGAWVAVALSRRPAPAVGIDVETDQARDFETVLTAGFSSRETQALKGAGNLSLCRMWTVKEAYLKLIRKGFQVPLKQVEILGGAVHLRGRRVAGLLLDSWQPDPSHWITVAVENDAAAAGAT
jgi:4'-phosphopantetheinyl transferase